MKTVPGSLENGTMILESYNRYFLLSNLFESISIYQMIFYNFLIYFFFWLLGGSIAGRYVVYLLIAVKGYEAGVNGALISAVINNNRLIFFLKHIIPSNIFILPSFFMAAFYTVMMSKNIKGVLMNSKGRSKNQFKIYTSKLIILFIVSVAGKFIEYIVC